MTNKSLHKAQISILTTLRHSQKNRYTDLRKPTGLESDDFKFHLRKLVHSGLVYKDASGEYLLTPVGKEFANNLDRETRSKKKQPKLSMLIIARRSKNDDKFLFQQRNRQPFFGYWGIISGPVLWGEDFESAAKREFEKQTGLKATYEVRSFYRQQDYETESKRMLEDKLFVVMEATNIDGRLLNKWPGGHSEWMTVEELKSKEHYFAETENQIALLKSDTFYREKALNHIAQNY